LLFVSVVGTKRQYHVQFFGVQKERGWISPHSLMVYEGRAAFEDLVRQHSDWAVSQKRRPLWEIAVADADRAVRMSRLERIQRLTFVYDSILPAHVWSKLPPTPAETPVSQKSHGGKRKTVSSMEGSNSVTTQCIDALDALAPPNKKRKKSITACASNSVKVETDDLLISVIKDERLEKVSKQRSQSRTKYPPENNEHKWREGSTLKCSPRKGLRSSLADSDHLPEPMSTDNNQFENSSVSIDVSKSPEKQLFSSDEATSGRSTRHNNSKAMAQACSQNSVAVSEREIIVDSEEHHKDVNTSPLPDIGRRLRPARKSETKDQAIPVPINGTSVFVDLQLACNNETKLQRTRGLRKSLTNQQLKLDGGESIRDAASGRRSSLSRVNLTREHRLSCESVSITDNSESVSITDNKVNRMSVRRRNSLPANAAEKPEGISDDARRLGKKNQTRVEGTLEKQPQLDPIVGVYV